MPKFSKTRQRRPVPKSTTEQTGDNLDIFNNAMTRSAMSALSKEDLERYKEIGKQLYDGIDFEDSRILNNMPPPMAEAVAYVLESIKSGMHPSMLAENEKELLKDAYGEKWYEKYGYVEGDLTEIVTLKI